MVASQPLTVREMGQSEIGDNEGLFQVGDGLLEEPFGQRVMGRT